MDNNQRLKAICTALRFGRSDVSAACKHGGYEISISNAALWLKGAGKELHNGPDYTPTGNTEYKAMPDIAFDAFCLGIRYHLEALEEWDNRGNR
ncbi:hypothetical protein [Carnimonas bestiolae]|uniref:hypothetical protein n=1 Tax=Carnimonas bestiolae TaxID=3402172 RepID=UPI003EDC7418